MLTLVDVVAAINERLDAVLPDIPIQSKDIREGFARPSLYVDFDNVVPVKYGQRGLDRTISVIIYFFPTSQTDYKMELLSVQDTLEQAFVDTLQIVEGFVVYPSNLASVKVDGILQLSFDIQLVEIKEEEAGYMIEQLSLEVQKVNE